MNILWQYIDKRSAAISALKDYESMIYTIDHTNEDIALVQDRMTAPRVSILTGMPSAHNPKARENTLVCGIDGIDVLNERYNQALEYMGWFRPAWESLSEDERFVLSEFYLGDDQKQIDAVYNVCDRFNIERSSAYNKKNRALQHLALLLFGK